jgi:hypothetical protein
MRRQFCHKDHGGSAIIVGLVILMAVALWRQASADRSVDKRQTP